MEEDLSQRLAQRQRQVESSVRLSKEFIALSIELCGKIRQSNGHDSALIAQTRATIVASLDTLQRTSRAHSGIVGSWLYALEHK